MRRGKEKPAAGWRKSFALGVCALLLLGHTVFAQELDRAAGQEEQEISVLAPMGAFGMLEPFLQEHYPQLSFALEEYPEAQYYTVLCTRLATGTGPDLLDLQYAFGGPNGAEELAGAGYLEPLWEKDGEEASRWKGGEIGAGDSVYGIASQRMALGVVYNREIFASRGLPVPRDWETFLSCCETLKEGGITPLCFGGKDLSSFQFGLYQIAANVIYPEDPDYDRHLREGSARFTDPGRWDQVLSMYFSLFDRGYQSEDGCFLTLAEAGERLRRGEAAMLFGTSLWKKHQSGLPEETFGFFPLPANPAGREVTACESVLGCFAIYGRSSHKELLKEVLKAYYESLGEEAFLPETASFDEGFRDCPAVCFCNQGWLGEVEVVLEEKVQEYLLTGEVEIRDILEAMQRELEK